MRCSELPEPEGPADTGLSPLLADLETEAERTEEASPAVHLTLQISSRRGIQTTLPWLSVWFGALFGAPYGFPFCLLLVLLLQALLSQRAGSG